MEEEMPEGEQTQPEILYGTSGPEETTRVQTRSTLQQVAREATKSAQQPDGFKIYEEYGPQRLPIHSLNIPQKDLQGFSESDSTIATTLEVPTTDLAAIAGDTAVEGNTGYSMAPFPDLEAEQHIFDDSAGCWVGTNVDGGSFEGSVHNEASSGVEAEQHQIQAFAKLEFDDGEFYMNTYAVEIGRDVHAARQAADFLARQDTETRSRRRSASAGGSITSSRARHKNRQNVASSLASESGGLMGVDSYESEPTRKLRSRKPKSGKPKSRKPKSWSSSSQQLSQKSSVLLSNGKTDYNALAMVSLTGHDFGPNDFGPNSPMPAPELVPLVPIHPPDLPEGVPSGSKSISRKHIRIAYNFEESLFEVNILGRNGGFVDDEWYAQGDVQTLMNGSIIQIGGVGIRFVLPDVAPGETGAEAGLGLDLLSGGKMSFDIPESIDDESDGDLDGDRERCRSLHIKRGDGDNDEEEEEEKEEKEEEEEEKDEEEAEEPDMVQRRAKGKKKPEPEPSLPTKRKGPGRPPKNGIISKREQALLARQARQNVKVATGRNPGVSLAQSKVKAGKDTKVVKNEQPLPQTNGKRKYTKRKRAGATNDQRAVRESTEHTDSVPPEQSIAARLPPKPAKEKRPPKPPRSPSPVFDEASLTPEQLTKPPQNYIVLIHEALSNSETGAMALPQIYRAMQRKYPYFKLRATTVGWQSSVRHNLSQNVAFRKIERDGKGWMWGLVPGVSIEKEKKRRATPPPVSQQPYYPPGPPPMQYPYPYPGMPPANGRMPANHYGIPPGMPPAPMHRGVPPRGLHGFPLPLVNAQSESTYQSPYQSTPPPQKSSAPAHPPQGGSSTNGANSHYPTPTSQPPAQASNYKHQPFGSAQSPSPAPVQLKTEALTGSLGESLSNVHDQGVVQAIARYKHQYIDNMPDKAKAEILVTSAINRTLGISNPKDAADEADDPREKSIIGDIATMLNDLSKQNKGPQRGASDDTFQSSKSSPTPAGEDSVPSLPAAAPRAAKAEVQNPLTNGDPHRRNGTVEKEAAEDKGRGKRPFEDSDNESLTEHGPPEAKRAAIEA